MARSRSQLINIGLAVMAAALVVAVVVTSGRVTTGEKEAREHNVLASYREPELSRITLERKNQRIVLERAPENDADATGAGWLIVEPVKEEAEVYAMQQLLGSLEYAKIVRRIKPEEVKRDAFGLDSPRLVISLDMGAIRYRLKIGGSAASPPGAAYLEVEGEGAPNKGVMIISKELFEELDVELRELRGQDLMPYLSSALKNLRLDGEGGPRHLQRGSWGGWRFEGMHGDRRVAREGLDRILLQLARTKAERFIPNPVGEQHLSKGPAVTITMIPTAAGQPKGVIAVGGRCPEGAGVVAVRREPDPVAACVPDSVMPGLTTPADELIDRGLFTVRTDEIESLSVTSGGKKLELDRKGNGFTLRAPEKAEVELDAGNARLAAILGIRGELIENPNLKELGLEPPAGQVTIKSSAEDDKLQEETLAVGRSLADGSAHVRRAHDGAVLKVNRDAVRLLSPDATLVRSRTVLRFEERQLKSLHIKAPASEQHLVRNPNGSYVLEQPGKISHDAGLIADVVDGLATLTTERWIADADDGSFGLQKPRLTVTITLQRDGGSADHVLRVGDLTSGGAFASLDGGGVFVLAKRTLDALETPLVDRSVFALPPEQTARVVLERQGRRIELEKQGDSFIARGAELSKGQIQQLVEALANMRAEAAAHFGPARANEGFDKPELTVTAYSVSVGGEQPKSVRYRIGAGDSWRSVSIFYGRVDGIDATFVIARSKVAQVLDAL